MAACENKQQSYWQKVDLQFADGETIKGVVLDLPTLTRLKSGDDQLLENIRQKYREAAVPAEATEKCVTTEVEIQTTSTEFPPDQPVTPEPPVAQSQLEKQVKMWRKNETQLLFETRRAMEDDFQSAKVHKQLWSKVVKVLADAGYSATREQCENKFKALKRDWRSVVDHNNISGNDTKTCPFFAAFNEMYGMKASTKPTFTLCSTEVTSHQNEDSPETSSQCIPQAKRRRSTSTCSKSDTPKSTLEWLKGYEERNLLNLPSDVLREIIGYLDMNSKIALASVKKSLRSVILGEMQTFMISSSAIGSPCCLNLMYSLKKLTIVGISDRNPSQSLMFLNDIVSTGCLPKVHCLEICSLQIDYSMLLSIISQIPAFDRLSTHINCNVLNYRFVEQLLEIKKSVRFISGNIDVDDPTTVQLFGKLINRLCGKVTFGHAIIESLPRNMLQYHRYMYSCPFPTGKY